MCVGPGWFCGTSWQNACLLFSLPSHSLGGSERHCLRGGRLGKWEPFSELGCVTHTHTHRAVSHTYTHGCVTHTLCHIHTRLYHTHTHMAVSHTHTRLCHTHTRLCLSHTHTRLRPGRQHIPPGCIMLSTYLGSPGLPTPQWARMRVSQPRVDTASSAQAGGWQKPGLGHMSCPEDPRQLPVGFLSHSLF